jgi:hypothetical protein
MQGKAEAWIRPDFVRYVNLALCLSNSRTDCAWKATLLSSHVPWCIRHKRRVMKTVLPFPFLFIYTSHILSCFVFGMSVLYLVAESANECLHN